MLLGMKLHRFGRVSFKAVKSKRGYLGCRTSHNWLSLSCFSAKSEFDYGLVGFRNNHWSCYSFGRKGLHSL